MFDFTIIGAGPAGISSAIYAVSRGLKTIVLEQKAVGGLLGGVLPSRITQGSSRRRQERPLQLD